MWRGRLPAMSIPRLPGMKHVPLVRSCLFPRALVDLINPLDILSNDHHQSSHRCIGTMHSRIIGALSIILASLSYGADCPCGWRLKEQNALYTHRLLEDFSQYPDVTSILNNTTAAKFNRDWMMYDF
jgi:hypothetical protein